MSHYPHNLAERDSDGVLRQHPAITRIEVAARARYPHKTISLAAVERIDPALLDAYITGMRVKVTNGDGDTPRTGRVSVTGGWQPTLMLMHRSNQSGSSDLLSATWGDRVVGWWDGRSYYDIAGTPAGIELDRRRAALKATV